MENQLSFPMDGITLQHAGELLFNTPVTVEERNNCHETYIRSLEDFCFAYMYGEKFSHTMKFPKIQDYEPGKMLCETFQESFQKLNDTNHPKPEVFVDDASVHRFLITDMNFAFSAFQRQPIFWKDWILRETKAHLGSDPTLFKDLDQSSLYVFNKDPKYIRDYSLQKEIPVEFINILIPMVRNSIGSSQITNKAIIEFISQSYLTHQTLFWWYNHLVGLDNTYKNIQVPHITRSLVRSVISDDSKIQYLKSLKDLLIRPALFEALDRISNRDELIESLNDLRNKKPYRRLRNRLELIFEELEKKNSTKGIDKLSKEIHKLSYSKTIENITVTMMTPEGIASVGGEIPMGLLMPNRSAFRRILVQYDQNEYYRRLQKVFPELKFLKT